MFQPTEVLGQGLLFILTHKSLYSYFQNRNIVSFCNTCKIYARPNKMNFHWDQVCTSGNLVICAAEDEGKHRCLRGLLNQLLFELVKTLQIHSRVDWTPNYTLIYSTLLCLLQGIFKGKSQFHSNSWKLQYPLSIVDRTKEINKEREDLKTHKASSPTTCLQNTIPNNIRIHILLKYIKKRFTMYQAIKQFSVNLKDCSYARKFGKQGNAQICTSKKKTTREI